MTLAGLPHSEISGSMRACRSPKRIVACHVLHRLSVPRHPPSTLSNLTIKCLDLMRSAVESNTTDSTCISFLQPVFNCQGTAVAKTNAELEFASDSRSPLVSRCLSLRFAAVTRSTRRSSVAVGGADRDRTDDPLLAKQVLSQLSYSPEARRFAASAE